MNSPWNKDWLDAQRQYMEALASFASTASAKQTAGTQSPEWQKTLENWWHSSQPVIPENSQAIFSNLLQHSESWYALSGQFDELLKTMAVDDKNTIDWQNLLAAHIEKMKSQVRGGHADNIKEFWQGGIQSAMGAWQNMINAMSSAADARAMDFQITDLQNIIDRYFFLPGIEQNHHAHEQTREGLRLWQACQESFEAYRETLTNVGIKALDKLQEKIVALADQKTSISSLREIYDLWVDSQEEAYYNHILTEEYSQLYARLVNSMLAFKAHSKQFATELQQPQE